MNLKAHKRITELKERVDTYIMEVTNGFISYAYETGTPLTREDLDPLGLYCCFTYDDGFECRNNAEYTRTRCIVHSFPTDRMPN